MIHGSSEHAVKVFFADFVAGFFLLIFVGKSAQKNPPGKSPAKSSKIYTTKIPDTFLQRGQAKKKGDLLGNQLFMGTIALPFVNYCVAFCELLRLFPWPLLLRPQYPSYKSRLLLSSFPNRDANTIGNSRITFHHFLFRELFLVIISSWLTSKNSGRIISRNLSDLHLFPHLFFVSDICNRYIRKILGELLFVKISWALHQNILGELIM